MWSFVLTETKNEKKPPVIFFFEFKHGITMADRVDITANMQGYTQLNGEREKSICFALIDILTEHITTTLGKQLSPVPLPLQAASLFCLKRDEFYNSDTSHIVEMASKKFKPFFEGISNYFENERGKKYQTFCTGVRIEEDIGNDEVRIEAMLGTDHAADVIKDNLVSSSV